MEIEEPEILLKIEDFNFNQIFNPNSKKIINYNSHSGLQFARRKGMKRPAYKKVAGYNYNNNYNNFGQMSNQNYYTDMNR